MKCPLYVQYMQFVTLAGAFHTRGETIFKKNFSCLWRQQPAKYLYSGSPLFVTLKQTFRDPALLQKLNAPSDYSVSDTGCTHQLDF